MTVTLDEQVDRAKHAHARLKAALEGKPDIGPEPPSAAMEAMEDMLRGFGTSMGTDPEDLIRAVKRKAKKA